MISDFNEFKRIKKIKQEEMKYEVDTPVFVKRHKKLNELWIKAYNQFKENIFDIQDTNLLPDNQMTQPLFIDILRKEYKNLDELIEKDNKEFLSYLIKVYKGKTLDYEELKERNLKNVLLMSKAFD